MRILVIIVTWTRYVNGEILSGLLGMWPGNTTDETIKAAMQRDTDGAGKLENRQYFVFRDAVHTPDDRVRVAIVGDPSKIDVRWESNVYEIANMSQQHPDWPAWSQTASCGTSLIRDIMPPPQGGA